MENIKLSVVILTKNNGTTIGKVLQQVQAQQIRNDYEIIVVDSGSSDDTIRKVSGFNVRFYTIPPGEFGHGRTRNLASGYATGDYIVYLSADAIPANENWLKNLVDRLAIENVAATFGRQIPYENTPLMERFFIQRNYPPILNEPYSVKDFNMNAFFSNVNSAIKRSVWKNTKFNEELIISEDHDWARKANELGYKIEYVPDAAVFHSHNYGLKQVFKRYFDSGVSFSQMYMKPAVLSNGIKYFIAEIIYVGRENFIKIPYAICYDIFKFTGFFFGLHHKWIPGSIKRHLSMHAYYWKK
ncbi:MAG: glycosyltransferase family 2 protein [Candidatus Methanoperedens sp.]|nr:glycosyltransferase family 2 protein [Candidatus Methanoperedens sp.]